MTGKQVEKIARLANLPLSEKELVGYSKQLPQILAYFEKLSSCQTEDIEPTFNTTDLKNVMREDEVQSGFLQEEALKNASITKKGLFVTRKILEK